MVLLSELVCVYVLEVLVIFLCLWYLDLLVFSLVFFLLVGFLSLEFKFLECFGCYFFFVLGRCLEEYGVFYVGGFEVSFDLDFDLDLSWLFLGWVLG